MIPFVRDPELKLKDHWVTIIHNLVYKKHSNWVQITLGATGSGKSSFNLSEAFKLDPSFTVCPERIAFSIKDFIKNCRHFDEAGDGKGKVVMLEEVGVEAASKDFAKLSAREFINVIQTFRSQGLILLMSVPDEELFLKDGRRLLKGMFITKRLDFVNHSVSVQPFMCERNPKLKKTYYYYGRVLTNYGIKVLDKWTLGWVPEQEWVKFETMMNDYKKHVRDRAFGKLHFKPRDIVKRKAVCNGYSKQGVPISCGFVWEARNVVSDVPPACPKCHHKNTKWL